VSIRLAVLTALAVIAISAPALARPKTDIVVLKNGDRFTGEIKSLDRGKLSLSTDSAGTLSIEWADVVEVTSPYQYKVETGTGLLLVASLGPAGPRRADMIGMVPQTVLDLADIVVLTPIGKRFWQRIDGSLDVGFSYTQSSGVAQLSAEFQAIFRNPTFESELTANTFFTRQPEEPDTSRNLLQVGTAWLRPGRWRIGMLGSAERNPDLGFDLRAAGSGLLGRDLVMSNLHRFTVLSGVSVNREFPVDAPDVTNVEAVLASKYSLFLYNYPKTSIDVDTRLFPSLSDTGRFRVELSAQFRRELWRDFTTTFSVYDSYDNRPPSESARTNDVALSLSIGWIF
jgi:Protein of unknown function, DUF481